MSATPAARVPDVPEADAAGRLNLRHLAFVGKGGAGKSVISATAARLLARAGHKVLALDSDALPGLSVSLGAQAPAVPPLNAAAEQDGDGQWRLRPDLTALEAIERFATPAPDGVRVLQGGKSGAEGLAPVMGAVRAFHAVIHDIPTTAALRDWVIVGDLSAGARQTALGWVPYADRMVLVVEPTWQSILTARRIARIARARRDVETVLVVNKVIAAGDVGRVEDALGLRALAAVPLDEDVRGAERLGCALLDHAPGSDAVRAIEGLAPRLIADTVQAT